LRPLRVADPDDPRVALYRGVRDPELLRDRGVFLVEGRLVVQRLLERSRFRARSVLVTPAALAALRDLLVPSPVEVLLVEQPVLDSITSFNVHRGCLAIGERANALSLDDLQATPGPLVILEHVGNPDNVGGTFRNASAFGASGVLLSPGCSDPLYRKAIRTSMGATLTTPFLSVESWPGTIVRLREAGWMVIAMSPTGRLTLNEALREKSERRVALLLGHEGDGLTTEAQEFATTVARIPMDPGADSLNVATAAAVALYETTRSG
jgi:tRNA G18 (ribose-2'-O)-methylase SpoU